MLTISNFPPDLIIKFLSEISSNYLFSTSRFSQNFDRLTMLADIGGILFQSCCSLENKLLSLIQKRRVERKGKCVKGTHIWVPVKMYAVGNKGSLQ